MNSSFKLADESQQLHQIATEMFTAKKTRRFSCLVLFGGLHPPGWPSRPGGGQPYP